MAMEKKYLIINIGSTSKRYAFYNNQKEVCNIHLDANKLKSKILVNNNIEEKKLSMKDYFKSINFIVKRLIKEKLIRNVKEITAITIRIVAPGDYFLKNKIIDKEYIKKLNLAVKIAPLHIKPVLNELKYIKKTLPKVLIIAISDSAFHSTMPKESRMYGIPFSIASKLEIFRYGYHGISMNSIINQIRKKLTYTPSKIIVCHLGGGSSITAIRNGESIENSMGLTPLEGLTGSTRIGNIDPAASIYLAKSLKLSYDKLEEFYNFKCGLKGLVNHSDIREVLDMENRSKGANIAIRFYTLQIKKYIGSYFALLNGLDLLIFTGAAGAGSPRIRELACENLSALGIILDKEKNQNSEPFIHSEDSKIKIMILKTNEIEEMLAETKKII